MEYKDYTPVFFSFLSSLAVRDKAILENNITRGIWTPVMNEAIVKMTVAAGTVAATFGAYGTADLMFARAQYALAQQNLLQSAARLMQATLFSVFTGLNTVKAGQVSSVGEVRNAELEYEKAQAELDYLTKAPSRDILVQRVTEFGDTQGYEFTEAEKQYIYDATTGQPDEVEAGDPEDALNITELARDVRCVDSMGVRYSCDPSSTDAATATEPAGIHHDNVMEGEKARKPELQEDGTVVIKSEGNTPAITDDAEEESAYDLGRVLKAMVTHGNKLREQAKARYIQASQSAEGTFALSERASTMGELVEWASGDDPATTDTIEIADHGGREYGGYESVYLDHLENAGNIQDAQLSQQVELQKDTWDARYEELEYKEALWESKMQTILNRGKDQWAAAENAFLTKWNDTKSAEEAAIADAEAKWQKRIDDHYAEKKAWEQQMRLRLAEKTLDEDLGSAIDDLNAQIRTNREALNADLPVIDRQAALNEAKDRLARQSLDKSALENANKRIEDFDTNVQLQLKSRELGAENIYNVMQDFQDDLEDHKDNMQVMAKVQILEEYRNLIDKFVESIKRQNEAKEQQTHTAALSAGYIEHGSQYIKKGQGSTNLGFVDAIRHYDIESEADNFKQTSQIFASEEQFNRLMEQSSMPEFQAILHVEKLKVQKWMESVSGTSQDPATRGKTNDSDKLGKFGMWIGRGPNGHETWLREQGAGKSLYEDYGSGMVTLAAQGMSDGLGQMGAAQSRPGMPGTPGFYLQLSFWNQSVAERNAQYVANAGDMDPISGALNMFNPVSALATAVHNVEVGSRVHGHDRGNLIEAQGVSWTSKVLPVIGKAIDKSIGKLWADAPLAQTLGHVLSAGIQVNERTGDYTLAYNDEAWIAASAAIAATWATWGYDDGGTIGGKAGEAAIVDQHTLDPWKTAVIDAGAQIGAAGVQYDSSGNATGWSVGEMTTADIAGAGVSFGAAYMSSEVSQNMSSMEYKGDIWDNLGIGLRNQMVSSAINGAASGINQMIGSRNRMAHTLGGIAGSQLHAYQLRQEREALMNQQRSEAILLEQARKAAENGRTQEAAGILMGLGYREQAKKLLDGTYGKAIRQFTNKGNDAPMAIATLLAKEGKGNWPAIEARARELIRAGKSEVEALQQVAAENGIDLRNFGSSAHMSRIMGRDATHRANLAKNTADQAYEQMSAVFDEVFSSQNQSAGQPRFIRDEVIGNWLHSVSPEWAEKARGLYGRSESVQGFDKRYSGKMYGAQDRLLQLPQDAGLPGWPGMRGRVHSDPENLLWEDISGGLNNGQYHGDFDHNLYLSKLRDYGAETVMPAIGLAPSDIGTFLNDRTMEIVEAAGDLSENPNARKELMRRLMKQGLSARKASSVLDAAGQLGKFTGFLNIAKTSAEFGWTMGEINGIQNDADRFRDEAYNMIVKREMNNLHRAFKQARSNVHSANSRLGWYSQDLLKLESRVNALTSTSATGESASVDVLRSLDLDRKYILDDIENAGHTIQTERARLVRINRAIKLLQNVRQAPPGQKFDQLQRYSAHLASNGYDGASHGYEVVSVAMEAELLRANTYGWNVQRMKGFGISAVPFPGASAMGSLYLWRNSAGIDFLKSIANYAEQKQKHQEYEYAY